MSGFLTCLLFLLEGGGGEEEERKGGGVKLGRGVNKRGRGWGGGG